MKATNGRFLTKALFWETSNVKDRGRYPPKYTLKEEEHTDSCGNTYKSAYKIYMESVDEYDAAERILGSQAHWDLLCTCKWFMDGVSVGDKVTTMGLKTWREHKQRKTESLAKKKLVEAAEEGNITAARILYGEAPKQKAGRKPKQTVNTKEDLEDNVSNFLDRVGS